MDWYEKETRYDDLFRAGRIPVKQKGVAYMVLKSKQARDLYKSDIEKVRYIFNERPKEPLSWQDQQMIRGLLSILEEYIEKEEAEA